MSDDAIAVLKQQIEQLKEQIAKLGEPETSPSSYGRRRDDAPQWFVDFATEIKSALANTPGSAGTAGPPPPEKVSEKPAERTKRRRRWFDED